MLLLSPLSLLAEDQTFVQTKYYDLQVPNTAKSAVNIVSKNGVKIFNLGAIKIGNKPKVNTWNCSYETKTTDDGVPQLIINFQPAAASGKLPTGFTVVGTLTCYDSYIDVLYKVDGCQGYAEDWSGTMARFGYLNKKSTTTGTSMKLGQWVRDDMDGLPYEKQFGKIVPFKIDGLYVLLAYGDDDDANLSWKDDNYRHVMPVKQADGSYLGHFAVLIAPESTSYQTMAAQWQGKEYMLALNSTQPYNWWTSNANMSVTAAVTNSTDESKTGTLKYWVADWNGNKIVNSSKSLTLAAGETAEVPIDVKPTDERGLYVLEASMEDADGNEVTFARTNLSLLPDYTFQSTPDNSIMGLSAYWALPDSASVLKLMKRMGVRWVRNGDNNWLGSTATAMYHTNTATDVTKTYTDAERTKIIENCFKDMEAKGSTIWEFGNEVNLKGDGVGKATYATQYVDWLKAIKTVQNTNDAWKNYKIISCGISGADLKFLDAIKDAGGWNYLDGIALHPGRGNYVPDYPVTKPWESYTKSDADSYWNYYGSIRQVKDYIKANGNDKDLYLTEIYACDAPNRSWYDTPSEAADNVVISYALAKAEGVKNALFYQLFNSVYSDIQGIDANDPEYFYGLANRDLSFKPSLLAYCNAAEAFDGDVKFNGWIQDADDENSTVRRMSFTTPRGNMEIVWDRTGGYTELRPWDNCFPEYWESFWEEEEVKHKSVEIAVPTKTVKIINSIGQATTEEPTNGKITLDASAHPQIVLFLNDSANGISNVEHNVSTAETYYTIDGIRTNKLHHGLNIIRQADGKVIKKMVK